MFSVGLLYSAQEFLSFISSNRVLAKDVRESFREFALVQLTNVLDVVQFAGWAGIDIEGRLAITEAGLRIARADSEVERLRIQLADLIPALRPPWLYLFPRGRAEAIPYLPLSVQQCLREADLARGETDEIIRWWDKFADLARFDERSVLTEIGREGEKRSLLFEESRTGARPDWKALYSNNAGYDLLSRLTDIKSPHLSIEVKSSRQGIDEARFYITVNEWSAAINTKHYVFHLWLLNEWNEPRIVSPTDMANHIPLDKGDGQWELAVVPFAAVAQ